jgi:hypothetical protein
MGDQKAPKMLGFDGNSPNDMGILWEFYGIYTVAMVIRMGIIMFNGNLICCR